MYLHFEELKVRWLAVT